MRAAHIFIRIMIVLALFTFLGMGISGCGTTTVVYQTVVVTPSPSKAATTTPVPSPTLAPPPPGIWCPVHNGQTPLTLNCEIFPSAPELDNPPQGEAGLAGASIGPQIGSNGPSAVTERMRSPWAADVICATGDNTNTGKARIIMVAHTGGADYYSWGDEPCGPPSAPSYGNEFFRKASVTVTLSIQPLTSNLSYWEAQLIQL
jgi:hypothetical protein